MRTTQVEVKTTDLIGDVTATQNAKDRKEGVEVAVNQVNKIMIKYSLESNTMSALKMYLFKNSEAWAFRHKAFGVNL